MCTKSLSIELCELFLRIHDFRRNDFACGKFCENNMAAPAESTEVKQFEDDISSDSSVVTLSTFTIDFGEQTIGPSLQDAFLQYKKKRQVCRSP